MFLWLISKSIQLYTIFIIDAEYNLLIMINDKSEKTENIKQWTENKNRKMYANILTEKTQSLANIVEI